MVDLISVHIPKTAGSAFHKLLLDVYGQDKILADYPPDRIHNPENNISEKIKVIHGHFRADKYKDNFINAKRLVWLRHPIFRLISEYFYAHTIQDKANQVHAKIFENDLGIEEFAALPQMQNHMSIWLNGVSLKEFDFVGIQEFYFDDLKYLQNLLGWKHLSTNKTNTNKFPKYHKHLQDIINNTQLMNKLAVINSKDMKLYHQALILRAQRRGESEFIQSTLADWSRSKFLVQSIGQELHKLRTELEQKQHWLKETLKQIESQADALEIVNLNPKEVSELLLGCRIDLPKSPLKINDSSISIEGWVIEKDNSNPVTSVIFTHNGNTVNQTHINKIRPGINKIFNLPKSKHCGFTGELIVEGIPSNSEILIQAIFLDKTQVNLGKIQTLGS